MHLLLANMSSPFVILYCNVNPNPSPKIHPTTHAGTSLKFNRYFTAWQLFLHCFRESGMADVNPSLGITVSPLDPASLSPKLSQMAQLLSTD